MSERGIVTFQQADAIAARRGASRTEVLAQLGPPRWEFPEPNDETIDEVWIYQHLHRGKIPLKHWVATYLYFKADKLFSSQRTTREVAPDAFVPTGP